jgi:putative endonuclease
MTVDWTVYIVRCSDDTLYTGIARDAIRRVEEHNGGKHLAANYTRARRPVVLVYQESVETRSEALKREYAIKQMGRAEKEALVKAGNLAGARSS